MSISGMSYPGTVPGGGEVPQQGEIPQSQEWQGAGGRPEIRSRPFVPPQDRLEAIYVGHIAKDVTDELLKKVLLQCGTITRWTRSRDPVADAPTSFGFCEFESPEAVWRVTRLIDGLSLGGSNLIVTCPQKTKELMEKWHSQRLFYLQKGNPHWTSEQVEEEFLQDDQRLLGIIKKIVEDIEEIIKKNRAEREEEEKAKAARMAQVRARLNDKRENVAGQHPKRAKLADGSNAPRGSNNFGSGNRQDDSNRKKRQAAGAIPVHIQNKQIHRIETVRQRQRDFDVEYEKRSNVWPDEINAITDEAQRKWRRFEEVMTATLPSCRAVKRMIDADLREVNYALSIPYIESLGRSVLYDFNAKELLELASKELDADDIPTARTWPKRVLQHRKQMREVEKRDDAQDQAESEAEEVEHAARLERVKVFRKRMDERQAQRKQALEEAHTNVQHIIIASSASAESTLPSEEVAKVQSEGGDHDAPDWNRLKEGGYFDKSSGSLRPWLVKRMIDYVGADDSEELADYILDLFPPQASVIPTKASLLKEMTDFLDDETVGFVDSLWDKLLGI